MKISEFLSRDETLFNVRISDKEELLQALAHKACAKLNLSEDEIFSELRKRERLGSTGMGNGVAIPHARFQKLEKPFGVIAKLKHPIDFEAIDGQPVDIVFALLLPTAAEGEQLGALACIARKLRASEDLVNLRRAKNAGELYSVVIG